ncbi:MAG: hypothetical protein AAGA30_17960 [Planctomycetota bacterium]
MELDQSIRGSNRTGRKIDKSNPNAKVIAMNRLHQAVFIFSVIGLAWLLMMAIHELGHVLGALISGGVVERVVLHPMTISRTDVVPNPNPLLVVWFGPILGCTLPILFVWIVSDTNVTAKSVAAFFAGFSLIANGAYISIGTMDQVGDCGVMIRHGSPVWLLVLFGGIAIATGLFFWHRLGSVRGFLANPTWVNPQLAYGSLITLLMVLWIGFTFSPR